MRSDHRHLTAYQIGCEVGQSVVLVLRPAILDRHILALDVAGFTNALPECGQKACAIGKRRNAEETDHRRCRLLPSRRQRPRDCCAAEQRDELAPPHVRHGVSPPSPDVAPRQRSTWRPAQSVCRILSLARSDRHVFGVDLNRSESVEQVARNP